MKGSVSGYLRSVRATTPLILQITNYVTVNDCANATICAGGSPVMSDHPDDAASLAGMSSAVVLNIGTINERILDIMLAAGKRANSLGIPVLLDPVGVGASEYRTESALRILEEVDIAVVKGNAGEIGVLSGLGGAVRGVDSVGLSEDPVATVESLARKLGCIVAMTGEKDYVSDGRETYVVSNGDVLMERVSGTGCMTSSVMGCFIGACKDDLIGAVTASLVTFSIAGEIAASKADGPGTFKIRLMDALEHLCEEDLYSAARIEQVS